ncbi:MAG: M20 aminoacylase family protein [Inquilinaceae bacterium]
MPILPRIAAWQDDLSILRRDIHAHPELGFEERRTATLVAERLENWGIDVHRGLAETGVVGTLRAGTANRAIALRADMDALPMPERTGLPYASTTPGRMHACGHDGHTTMLLGAARYLAETRRFDGVVHFVFQPAEEGRGGGRRMVEDGLFDLFPAEAVFGMHNMPGLAVDQMAVTPGPQLASSDSWEAVFRGEGTHGAKPHLGRDAITAAGHFLTTLQTVPGRRADPLHPCVVSACSLVGGDPEAWNVIPDRVAVRGTARAFDPAVRDLLEAEIGHLAHGVARTFGIEADYRFIRRIPPVINDPDATGRARRAAAAVVGEDRVIGNFPPSTAGDDFAFLADGRAAAYVWVGNGPAREGALHHNGRYDFNDDAIATGASFWAVLVEQELAPS